MNSFRVRSTILLLAGFCVAHCGPQQAPKSPIRRANNSSPGVGGGDGSSGNNPNSGKPTAAQLAKSNDFFINKVQPLFKDVPCSDCHNAPRNIKDPAVAGPLTVLEHNSMYALLKSGTGANSNKLINKLLNVTEHRGGKVCADENAQPCGTVKEWYRMNFGDGVLSLGKVENINREGVVSGWAGSADSPSELLEIRFYLDGEKGTGASIGTVMANADGFDNGLSGNHSFALKVPPANIDGKQHKIWAYAVKGGQEVILAGSPFPYQAFKQKSAAVATSYAQVGFAGCNGQCHNFVYENRWGVLLSNGSDGNWSATNNQLYDKISGKVSHGGPGLSCGSLNCTALQAWWAQEFAQ